MVTVVTYSILCKEFTVFIDLDKQDIYVKNTISKGIPLEIIGADHSEDYTNARNNNEYIPPNIFNVEDDGLSDGNSILNKNVSFENKTN